MLATEGVGPGFSTFNFATLGYDFEIEIVVPPVSGGGGGAATSGGFWVPLPKKLVQHNRQVQITVKMNGKTWRTMVTVDSVRAELMVKVVNILNTSRNKFNIGVTGLKKVLKSVTASFDKNDK